MRIVQLSILLLFLPCSSYAAEPALLTGLPDAEHDYYEQVFLYVMENVAPGKPYDWQSNDNSGAITPEKIFVSKSGSMCRKFNENFTIGGQTGARMAYGCKRNGDDGWCRISEGNPLTCALEKPEGWFDKTDREVDGSWERDKNNLKDYRDDYSPF